ncbi:M48 family metallopeptidase [Shimia biformata]|uniref:M48 family metallopeptidase n=1 Tax=Shimia biformata TaxID=1294299 RepID=UPI0019505D14|nr:M48 family metallopeptidase [Shimia biformata]
MPTVIRVGAKPDAVTAFGIYFDGETAIPNDVVLTIDEARSALRIHVGAKTVIWPLADIRRVPDQADRSRQLLRLAGDPVARLFTEDQLVTVRCPNLGRRVPTLRTGRLMSWAAGAVASVAIITTVLVPVMANQLADVMPARGEKALGDATFQQIRSVLAPSGADELRLCESPQGVRALSKIRTRLEGAMEQSHELTVAVLDHGMVNAFALPGGYVVFFRGLIEAAESPEELASVFAHEIGHVDQRHVTRHVLRSAGTIGVLGLLFGDFAGGALILFLTERLIRAQYSQAAETEADEFSIELLPKAGVSPEAQARMFERFRAMAGEADGLLAHFLTHPRLSERIDMARNAVPEGFEGTPLLTDAEWQELKRICR